MDNTERLTASHYSLATLDPFTPYMQPWRRDIIVGGITSYPERLDSIMTLLTPEQAQDAAESAGFESSPEIEALFSTEDWDNEPTQSDISPMPLLTPPGNFPLANALLSWHDMGMDPTEWLQFWDKGRQAESIPSIFE